MVSSSGVLAMETSERETRNPSEKVGENISNRHRDYFSPSPSLANFRAKLQPEMMVLSKQKEINFYSPQGNLLYTLPKELLGMREITEIVVSPNGKGMYIVGFSRDKAKDYHYKLLFVSDHFIEDMSPSSKLMMDLYISDDETLYVKVVPSMKKDTLWSRLNGQWRPLPVSMNQIHGYYPVSNKLVYVWGYGKLTLRSPQFTTEMVQDTLCLPVPGTLFPLTLSSIEGRRVVTLSKNDAQTFELEKYCFNKGEASSNFKLKEKDPYNFSKSLSSKVILFIKKMGPTWDIVDLPMEPLRFKEFSNNNIFVYGYKGSEHTWAFVSTEGHVKVCKRQEEAVLQQFDSLVHSRIRFIPYLEGLAQAIFTDREFNLPFFLLAMDTLSQWPEPVHSDNFYKVFLKVALDWLGNPLRTNVEYTEFENALARVMGAHQETWLNPYVRGLYFEICLDSSLTYLAPIWTPPLDRKKLFEEALAHHLNSQDPHWPQNRIEVTQYSVKFLTGLHKISPDFFEKYRFSEPLEAMKRALIQLEDLEA